MASALKSIQIWVLNCCDLKSIICHCSFCFPMQNHECVPQSAGASIILWCCRYYGRYRYFFWVSLLISEFDIFISFYCCVCALPPCRLVWITEFWGNLGLFMESVGLCHWPTGSTLWKVKASIMTNLSVGLGESEFECLVHLVTQITCRIGVCCSVGSLDGSV